MVRTFLIVLSVIVFGCTAAADSAKHNDTVPGWGQVTDPDGDCTVKSDKHKLTITVPGKPHDLSDNYPRRNAPRVLRDIEGDFSLQVKVTSDFDPGETPADPNMVSFNGAGLLIWADEKNYVRLERDRWYTPCGTAVEYPPLIEYWKGGEPAFINPGAATPFFKGRSPHLYLERRGNKVQVFVSHDGKEWLFAKPLTTALPRKVKVGVAAINTSKRAFTVEYEGFAIKNGKEMGEGKKDAKPLGSVRSDVSTDNAAYAAPAAPADAIYVVRQATFFLPVKLERNTVKEIRLFVSRDQGKTWKKADTMGPRKSYFTFTAPEDGDYWFEVQTVDADGELVPRIIDGAGLKVRVRIKK